MRVCILHYKSGTDGVSLEIKKRIKILKRLGLKPCFVAGSGNADYVIPELSILHKSVKQFNMHAFKNHNNEGAKRLFKRHSEATKTKLDAFFDEVKPDLLIVHNLFSLAYNLPASHALAEVIRQRNLKTEAIHHDFWWDRDSFVTRSGFVRNLMLDILPPHIPQIVSHIVLNSIERKKLLIRRKIKAKVFGDLFDFEEANKYTKSELKRLLKLKQEVVFLQATRILRRKAIEISIDFIERFMKRSGKKATLLLTNPPEKYIDMDYLKQILAYAKQKQVKLVLAYKKAPEVEFFEFYKVADFVLYPTILEGFGNQFLEAVYYKKLPILFEYEVFREDLKKEGYLYISLGERYRVVDGMIRVPRTAIDAAVRKALYYLARSRLYSAAVDKNFQIAKQHHSPRVLENYYRVLLASIAMEKTIANVAQLFKIPSKEVRNVVKKLLKI
ncbi:hypothetical protein DRJ48_04180 [Candidatus Woesearchaeota archaeon]|nr:MAG: hypothetical protein DRJ48_04180 [Candidatus Woesearchaeota archaeon]